MFHTDTHPTPGDLLAEISRVHAVRVQAEADLLALACAWADAHPDLDAEPPGVHDHAAQAEYDPLIPPVAWDAPAAFAAALGVSTQAGEGMLRDALVLRHRLPQVWARVQALEVPAWRARQIARRAFTQPADVTAHLDEHVAPVAEKVGPVTLDRLIDDVTSS